MASASKHLAGLVDYSVPTAGMFVWMNLRGVEDSFKMVTDMAKSAKVWSVWCEDNGPLLASLSLGLDFGCVEALVKRGWQAFSPTRIVIALSSRFLVVSSANLHVSATSLALCTL